MERSAADGGFNLKFKAAVVSSVVNVACLQCPFQTSDANHDDNTNLKCVCPPPPSQNMHCCVEPCSPLLLQDIDASATPETKPVLVMVASLYGMTRLQNDAAFFLESGIIDAHDRYCYAAKHMHAYCAE